MRVPTIGQFKCQTWRNQLHSKRQIRSIIQMLLSPEEVGAAHWPFDDDMFWDLWPSSSDSVRCPFVIGNCRWFLSLVTVSDLCQRQQQWFFVGSSQWFCSICLKSPSSWGLLAASDPAIKANRLLCNVAVGPTIRHHDDHNDEEGDSIESIGNEQDGRCA